MPVLAHARGFRVGEIEVNHRPRQHGSSKYGVSRFLKGFLDLLTVRFLTRFRQRPLHVLGGMGLGLLSLGVLGLGYLAVLWLLGIRPIGNRPMLFYAIALLVVGVQLLSLGILAELVTAYNIRRRGYVQHRRDHRAAPSRDPEAGRDASGESPRSGAPYPTTRGRCVDTADTGFDARKVAGRSFPPRTNLPRVSRCSSRSLNRARDAPNRGVSWP